MELALRLRTVKDAVFLVLKSPFYFFVAILVAFLMLSLSILILNFSIIFDPITPNYAVFDKLLLLLKLLGGLITNNTLASAAVSLITSLLAGINVAMLAFKIKCLRSVSYKEGGLGTSGAFAGVLATGCASCGLSVLSLIGLAGSLTFLPFKGLELGILGIFLLLFSVYWISKGISQSNICKVQLKA